MLYQLFAHQFKRLGKGFVQIDAPFEKYGKLLSDKRENGTFLIRGIGNKKPTI